MLQPSPRVTRSTSQLRASLGFTLLGSWLFASEEWWAGILYVHGLHGSLGAGVWPALLALWALSVVLVLAPAVALAWPALRNWRWRRAHGFALGALGLCAAASMSISRAIATTTSASLPTASDVEPAFAPIAALGPRLPGAIGPASLLTAAPAQCAEPLSAERVTLVATFTRRDQPGAPVSICRQAENLDAAVSKLKVALKKSAARGHLKVDLLRGKQTLRSRHAWLDALKLRPGLDGVCRDQRCLMPWQLLAHGFFSTHRPLDFIPDFQFGVASARLHDAFGVPDGSSLAGFIRITTDSYSMDMTRRTPRLTPLARMRRRDVAVTAETLARAERNAESYVLGAQQPDGKFRYTLDPMSGDADVKAFNLARQAGTTLVLCELGQKSDRVAEAVARSLTAMLAHERRRGGIHALTHDAGAKQARLSESALPWVSLLACRGRVGARFDEHIVGMANYILAMQRDNGSFAPALDLESGQPLPGREPLYAGGQAVLGLVLLEGHLQAHPRATLPPYELVHEAVERAMRYVATDYWSHPLRDFFFLEENWHCLAARAALGVHRHAGYERFCEDYVRFKARLILHREDGIDADFDGGFGFGNVVPPHNTGAAGFGEALAAMLSLRHAQGRPAPEYEALLRRVLGFLLRQQWTPENCFACKTSLVVGGMSEHTHSALTRIDFAQHAWAALGHGGRVSKP